MNIYCPCFTLFQIDSNGQFKTTFHCQKLCALSEKDAKMHRNIKKKDWEWSTYM